MSTQANKNFLIGTVSMGLIIAWINSLPLYGPLLIELKIKGALLPFIFTISHVIGLLGGSWLILYRPNRLPEKNVWFLISFTVAALTILIIFIHSDMSIAVWAALFIYTGLLTGLLISRWMAWFSSDETSGLRGSIFGKAVGISYILLSIATLLIFQTTSGPAFTIVLIALIIFVGGALSGELPIPWKQSRHLKLREALPPLRLIFFAVIGYSSMALASELVTTWSSKHPILSWLLLIPYILIGFILGPYLNHTRRYLLFILAFLFSGLGFLTLLIATDSTILNITFSLLVNSSLIFIHLFYWLSLVENQNTAYAPLPLAIGVSIELLIFAVIYYLATFIANDFEAAHIITGVVGVALILLGFALLTAFREDSILDPGMVKTWGLRPNSEILTYSTDTGSENNLSRAYYIYNIGIQKFQQGISKDYNLTGRELEIAYLMAAGMSNNEIINDLRVSKNTLKYHQKNLYTKLSVSKRGELILKLLNEFK